MPHNKVSNGTKQAKEPVRRERRRAGRSRYAAKTLALRAEPQRKVFIIVAEQTNPNIPIPPTVNPSLVFASAYLRKEDAEAALESFIGLMDSMVEMLGDSSFSKRNGEFYVCSDGEGTTYHYYVKAVPLR